MLGLAGAQASPAPEATIVARSSSNPAINAIIDTGPQTEKRLTPSSRFSKKLGIAAGSTAGITAGKAATPSGGLHVLRTFLRASRQIDATVLSMFA